MKNKLTIAFDFDGVIHKYSKGWQDGSIYDDIDEKWIELTKKLLSEGHNIFILSTRPKRQIFKKMKKLFYDDSPSITGLPCNNIWRCCFAFHVMPFWEKFFKKRNVDGYPSVGICNHKAVFDVLIDDRAIRFKTYEGLYYNIMEFKGDYQNE